MPDINQIAAYLQSPQQTGSSYMSEEAKRRILAAQILGKVGSDTQTPVYSKTAGMMKLAAGGLGGIMEGMTEGREAAANKANAALLAQYIGGAAPAPASPAASGGLFGDMGSQAAPPVASSEGPVSQNYGPVADVAPQGGMPPVVQPANPATTLVGSNPDYGNTIASIESGGKYDALGPVIPKSGDRAYGKYQVMGANVGPWTKEILGQELTPQQFAASPEAQEKVFQTKFGQYAQKHGPEGAARAWFAGEGGMNNPNAKDMLGTSVADYAQKFNKALPQGQQMASLDSSAGVSPQGVQAPQASAPAGPSPQALAQAITSPAQPGMDTQRRAIAAQLLADPRTPPQMRAMIMQQMTPDNQLMQMPDGTVISVNKRDNKPTEVYKAQSKPTFGVTGEDQFGNKQYGFIDTYKGTTTPANGSAAANAGPAAPVTVTDANGRVLTVPPGQDPKKFREHITTATADAMAGKLTEVQANATQFANRMEDAEKNIAGLEGQGGGAKGAAQQVLGKVPVVGSGFQSADYQKFSQAKSQFITALLRKESGAAIGATEFERYDREYFPQPGDEPGVIAQKRNARQIAIDAMKKGAGPVYQSPASGAAPAAQPSQRANDPLGIR